MLWITADLGNTALKLRAWRRREEQGPERVGGIDLCGPPDARTDGLARWLDELDSGAGPRRAALVSVAAEELTRAVAEALGSCCGELLGALHPGLENRTRAPEGVGVDRLWAARGALHVVGRSAIVVDAGTALTVDAAVIEPGGARAFLGGAIAPGPALLARSLAREAARLPEVTPRPDVPALGRDTEEAIRSGVAVGFRGAARELVLRIAEEAGLASPPIVVTGGARAFLLRPAPFLAEGLREEGDLIHLGLLAEVLVPHP